MYTSYLNKLLVGNRMLYLRRRRDRGGIKRSSRAVKTSVYIINTVGELSNRVRGIVDANEVRFILRYCFKLVSIRSKWTSIQLLPYYSVQVFATALSKESFRLIAIAT